MPFHDANNGPSNHLMRNDGNDRFLDVTREVGLDVNNARFSLAATWADYDNDGDPDLYVANDFGRNNLYRNDGNHFVDVAATAGAEDQAAGMGASWSDFDLDGDFDLYVSNMFSSAGRRIAYQPQFKEHVADQLRQQIQRHALGNSLLQNQGDGTFRDISDSAGVRMGRWSWGSKFIDLNNDGYDDLIVPNGFLTNDRKDDL
ncbi:MAG: VCBS repeat-containing protein [Planctomycetota bacterium]